MADVAQQTQFRQEMIAGFEVGQSLLRESTTTEVTIKGNSAVFLVADSGGAVAKTRGANGRIPGRSDSLTQNTVLMTEWHDKPERTGYNLWAGQGDQRALMQTTCKKVINRKVDDQIIVQLNTATNDTGAARTADMDMAVHAKTILGNNAVPFDGNICGVISPSMEGYLLQVKEFANNQYVNGMPIKDAGLAWKDQLYYYVWLGIKWIVHPTLPGAGTNAEKCFMYHRSAIGHAANSAGMEVFADYNEEDDYSWARCSMYMESLLLQNSGVVVMNHDGAAYAAQ